MGVVECSVVAARVAAGCAHFAPRTSAKIRPVGEFKCSSRPNCKVTGGGPIVLNSHRLLSILGAVTEGGRADRRGCRTGSQEEECEVARQRHGLILLGSREYAAYFVTSTSLMFSVSCAVEPGARLRASFEDWSPPRSFREGKESSGRGSDGRSDCSPCCYSTELRALRGRCCVDPPVLGHSCCTHSHWLVSTDRLAVAAHWWAGIASWDIAVVCIGVVSIVASGVCCCIADWIHPARSGKRLAGRNQGRSQRLDVNDHEIPALHVP